MDDDWKWYAGDNDESLTLGPFDSREAAIAEGTDYFADCADWLHILEAQKATFPPPSAHWIILDMFENASEGLFGEDYPEPLGTQEQHDEAEAELQALLNSWMDKWRNEIFPTPWTFNKIRNHDVIPLATAQEVKNDD